MRDIAGLMLAHADHASSPGIVFASDSRSHSSCPLRTNSAELVVEGSLESPKRRPGHVYYKALEIHLKSF